MSWIYLQVYLGKDSRKIRLVLKKMLWGSKLPKLVLLQIVFSSTVGAGDKINNSVLGYSARYSQETVYIPDGSTLEDQTDWKNFSNEIYLPFIHTTTLWKCKAILWKDSPIGRTLWLAQKRVFSNHTDLLLIQFEVQSSINLRLLGDE